MFLLSATHGASTNGQVITLIRGATYSVGELTVNGGSMLRDGTSFATVGAKRTLIILDGAFHERGKLVVNGTLIVAGVSRSAFVGQSPVLRPGTIIVGPGGTLAGSGLNMLPGFQFDLRRDGGGLTMVALNDSVSVPEPATAVMLMCAGVSCCLRQGQFA